MSDVTRILDAVQSGDVAKANELLSLVYEELRRLAAARMSAEPVGQTLSATALVHEAFLRLVGSESQSTWQNRSHFFAAAAQAMRRILIENARRKKRLKRGGNLQRVEFDEVLIATENLDDEMLAVHESLDRLTTVSSAKAKLVELRYFAGLSAADAASMLGISKATADRDWAFARAWLKRDIESQR
ncbi:MAG: sigma-70 family RNA polymerase sigma factor [Planctomycetales bacterium]|nr:sigma-70 family RNA polymerase sigma factor [Planctomycetales bacterium]